MRGLFTTGYGLGGGSNTTPKGSPVPSPENQSAKPKPAAAVVTNHEDENKNASELREGKHKAVDEMPSTVVPMPGPVEDVDDVEIFSAASRAESLGERERDGATNGADTTEVQIDDQLKQDDEV